MKTYSVTFAVAAVLVALVTSAQSGTTKTPMTPAATPTHLPVKLSMTTASQTKDNVHTTTGTSESRTNPFIGAVNVASASVNATTPKPEAMTDGQAVVKQKFKMIAVKCQEEMHAPKDVMVIVTNRTLLPQNEQQRCFLECVYKAMDLVKNNKFNGDRARQLAQMRFANDPKEHNNAVMIIEICEKEAIVNPKTTEKCAAGQVIRSCFAKNILKF